MKAMILAAGLGTRLRPITEFYAKPAVPFLNVPMLDFAIEFLREAGADDYVINSHYKPEQIRTLAAQAPGLTKEPVVTLEEQAPLGSGGGIKHAQSYLTGENFWLANGDEVILPQNLQILRTLRDRHLAGSAIATILVMKHPLVGTQFGGVWADASGRVRGFGRSGDAFGPGLTGYHYIGLQILNQRIFDHLPEGESNILYDGLTQAIAAGERVDVLEGSFTWFETGNPKDYLEASLACLRLLHDPARARGDDRRFLMQVLARFSQRDGGTVEMEKSGDASAARAPNAESKNPAHRHGAGVPSIAVFPNGNAIALVAPGAKIAEDARLEGCVVIGEGAVIERGATVDNSVVIGNSRVESGVSLKDQIFCQPPFP